MNDRWLKPESYKEQWDGRAEQAARWLPRHGRIADIGCGARFALRRFVSAEAIYVPADMTAWTPDVIRVDLNALEFPPGEFSAVAILGVLEYLDRPGTVIRWARKVSNLLVFSYCLPQGDDWDAHRKKRGWINALREERMEKFLASRGWSIAETDLVGENDTFKQLLYRCTSTKARKPESE
jgi:hypothetical protein